MDVARTVRELRERVRRARRSGSSIGVVPTMGALHDGHAELLRVARGSVGLVVATIFVNPTQFGPNEDYTKYPRTEESDLAACEAAGADLVFAPAVEEVYPRGCLGTHVEPPKALVSILEGAARPGHFRGVATVVAKLFGMVQPDVAWFGEKDYQQLLVIRRMVEDLDLPVEVRGVPTVREADGLAMSSRNRYLSPVERAAATVLWRAIQAARRMAEGGETDASRIRQEMVRTIELEPLATLGYATLADPDTLEPVERLECGRNRPARALIAARVGPARLIDNAAVG